MKITILTLFPEMFIGPFDHSIIKRALEKNLVEIEYINIREFGIGRHRIVDDTPYGGGKGMLLRVDIVDKALKSIKRETNVRVVLLDARGKTFTQQKAQDYAALDHLILLAGHYEGVDERIRSLVDDTISIGDFVVTGGEIPAMLITDAVIRLLPGAIAETGTDLESFSFIPEGESQPLLEYPQYTKPQEFNSMKVPEVLLSGDHKKIKQWRHTQALNQTQTLRPDLLSKNKNDKS